MAIGTANQTTLSFIKEVTPGVTPNSPAMQLLRFTGESLSPNNTTTTSEEIRDDRAISDLVITDQSNAGDINAELSGAAFDEFMEAALFSDATWTSVDNTGETTIAASATQFTDSGNGLITAGLQVGQFINITGFSNTAIDGFYRITVLTAGAITVYPAPTATETAGQTVTYKGSTIKTGTKDHAYTIQKTFKDTTTKTYQNFRGQRVAVISQSLSVGGLATIVFGFVGLSSEVTETQISGLSEVLKSTKAIMNSVGDVSNITAVGTSMTNAIKFTELSFSLDNALRELKAIGTLGSVDVRAGTIVATTTINPYFESKQVLDAFANNETFVISWQVTGSDNYSYIFSLPACKFTAQTIVAGAKDTDMIIAADTQAILDSNSSTTMRIDRFTP